MDNTSGKGSSPVTPSEAAHELIEIPYRDWPELRDLFANNWPDHIVGYSTVDNFIQWRRKCGGAEIKHLKFYSLDGDWRSDGTFVAIDRYQLFLNSLVVTDDDDEDAPGVVTRLETALGLLDWSNGFKVSSFRHRREVVRVVESKRLEREFDSKTICYYLPRQRAAQLSLKVPDDMVLKPLKDCDAPLADSLWPNRHSGSLFLLRRLLKWNPSIGAYKKLPDGSELLVGWSFILQAGALGALQVRNEFQGQGIGTLVTATMARLLSEQDKDAFGFVGPVNVSSKRMFERLGFKDIGAIYWLRTFPAGHRDSIWDKDSDSDL